MFSGILPPQKKKGNMQGSIALMFLYLLLMKTISYFNCPFFIQEEVQCFFEISVLWLHMALGCSCLVFVSPHRTVDRYYRYAVKKKVMQFNKILCLTYSFRFTRAE